MDCEFTCAMAINFTCDMSYPSRLDKSPTPRKSDINDN
jgi:hypothetical protein